MACSARLFFIPQLLADIFLNYSITQNHKKDTKRWSTSMDQAALLENHG